MTALRKKIGSRARLAQAILLDGTPYFSGKSLITKVFKAEQNTSRRDQIMLRLTVIDSYYSTNMGKRYYGIDDLADGLLSAGTNDDDIRRQADEFLGAVKGASKLDNRFSRLFTQRFGLTKKGMPAGRAASLLSKYLYFLSSYGFPIYDRLAVESLRLIASRYPILNVPIFRAGDPISYFTAVLCLNEQFGDIDLLDNLLWLIGKVREGNLSLVLSRERFAALRVVLNLPTTAQSIKDAARDSIHFRSVVGDSLCQFISFVADLE